MAKQSLFLALLLFTFLHGFAQSGKVVLQIEGIQTQKGGEISAGIFTRENFPKVGKQLLGKEVKVTSSRMEIVFDHVPAGFYGLVAFQDIDQNKELKTNLVGYPKEPIGFSREAKINFGPPSFADAQLEVVSGKTLSVKITLK
jgi:uncharacterized protein (DUF2141 family)